MANADLNEFYGRVGRIEKARALGYGFEAEATLGRPYYRRPRKKQRSILLPLLFCGLCAVGLKGTLHHQVGASTYESRVTKMIEGDGFTRLGGYLMKADPATLFVSRQLGSL